MKNEGVLEERRFQQKSFIFYYITRKKSIVLAGRGKINFFRLIRLKCLTNRQDVPIIPVYTNGEYFHGKKAKVVIGKPIDVKELYDDSKSEKENLAYISERLRQKVIDLGGLINGK